MTKNQKIAAGCGGLGCLALIVAVIVGAAVYFYTRRAPVRSSNYNFNSNSISNRNTNADESANNSSSSNPGSETSSSYSDDEKHRLFQAASMSQDAEVVQKVVKKLGLYKADYTPADDYPQFIKDHVIWGASNSDFIRSLDTPEKARTYVDAHL